MSLQVDPSAIYWHLKTLVGSSLYKKAFGSQKPRSNFSPLRSGPLTQRLVGPMGWENPRHVPGIFTKEQFCWFSGQGMEITEKNPKPEFLQTFFGRDSLTKLLCCPDKC